ncbi:MAG: single-stranded-DNA-specific exonuclease RecJ [Candidatus Paceibacterota bacterium]
MHSEFLTQLLNKRGLINKDEIESFLNPLYETDFFDPFLMRDMEKSCVRIFDAIKNNEKIVIYTDYDCDGIPGAVILSDLFKKIKYPNFEVYIPERNSEGYGLNIEAVESFKEGGVDLLITIDLGITAVEEVALANSYGIAVIITDHHIPHALLPDAYAILNPKVDDYPEKMLCGSGVVFKLVCGFLKKYGEEFSVSAGWEKWLLDMAGLATLSDMVPLLGENRAIAYYGMKVLRKSPRPGLQKLLSLMKINQSYLATDDVTFMITPRINAASRMDSPMRAFELLATNDVTEGGVLAKHLSSINDERKSIVLHIMKEVKAHFDKREELKDFPVIVMGSPSWRVGVLGIVAGKIMDEYDKPVFVWGKDENDVIKGSCRSPGSVSVVELMTHAKEYFVEFGGHELAGGFAVHHGKVHFLEEALSISFKEVQKERDIVEATYDLKLRFSDVNIKNNNDLERMEPFGLANPKPVFLFESVKIDKIKKFGKNNSGEHLEITFSDSTKKGIVAISFFSTVDSFNTKIEEGLSVNLTATFDLSRFRGRPELRLRIVDIY